MEIIGLAGRKQSGKTELANVCKTEFNDVMVFSFGNALKNLCADILNISFSELNEIKNTPDKFSLIADDRWISIIHKRTKINKTDIKKNIENITFTSVRMMLQIIGTNIIRRFNNNWHVDTLINEIKEYEHQNNENKIIIVDDCRFINEKKALEELGAKIYFILRPNNFNVSNHDSETGLKWSDFDCSKTIINNVSVEKLREYWHIEMIKQLKLSPCLENFENPILGDNVNNVFKGFKYSFSINNEKWNAMAAGIILGTNSINKKGDIFFHTDNQHLYNVVYSSLYGELPTNDNITDINIYNPYIIENLKMYMD